MNKSSSSDPSVKELLPIAKAGGIETIFDRHQVQQPQCGFGSLGLCCRICWKGPCRIDPFGEGPKYGICGADKDTIVARQLSRMMAAGAAAHSEHGRHIALALLAIADSKLADYKIHDEVKLFAVAKKLGIATDDRSLLDVVRDVAEVSLQDFQNQDHHTACNWLKATLTSKRMKRLTDAGVMPHNIDAVVAQTMARTNVGCDADYTNVILGGVRAALADFDGMALATELSDALFGTPKPTITAANLGVIKPTAVNIAVNGHNPLLSEVICDVAKQMNQQAIEAGAKDGINIVGICCTGNEVMIRHGIPLAANYLSQEMAIITGALDAMVVDVQCIMPSLPRVAQCFHTQVITTMDENKISGAKHVSFHEEHAAETAREIISLAISAYQRRDPKAVHIPDYKQTAIVGFSAEAIIAALSAVDAKDPLKPLIDNIVNGNIQGVALFAGCNNTRTEQDESFQRIAKQLAKNNVLLLATGCGAGALAKQGLMTSEATEKYAGAGLKAVLTAIGNAAGLNAPLPLVLHMGSCVDNSRAVAVATALAEKLGVDLNDLPVVACAPEAMSEKAVAIGTWSVAIGLPTHLGTVPQALGSPNVVKLITEDVKSIFGGYFLVEPDPDAAAEKLFAIIKERRAGLGI
ncbi:MAG TPA: anaerobic carbon-monoxide dehydrogenase catalytic subunit [Candidatus Saccharimonadales bacterium]|nr:anaerobic carbon-monoxide dehydrogenase catalytic subunit [Candidatus Saccharimonadales bacterium]